MKYEDINNIKEIIDEEYNNLLNLKNIANPKTEFEEYEEWATRAGGGRYVKKTSRKYNFPLIKKNLQHYFYFLLVRVSNILKF